MNAMELIRQRRSVRAFDGKALKAEDREKLLSFDLEDSEVMPCVSPLGYPAAKPSIRESLMRKGIKADSRMDFDALFFDGGFDRALTQQEAGEFAPPLEMVRWAPSAVNKQPWRVVLSGKAAHFYEKRSRGYVDGAGWDLQKIDLGIALCHFACGLEAQGRSWHLAVADPGFAVQDATAYVATIETDRFV